MPSSSTIIKNNSNTNNIRPCTKLVGKKFDGDNQFSEIIESKHNGKLYLIPSYASKVVTFDPRTKERKEIGFDLTKEASKWWEAVYCPETHCIFCSPLKSNNILIIDTKTDAIELIPLPEEVQHDENRKYGASVYDAPNQCVFFFPNMATKILKMNIHLYDINIIHNLHPVGMNIHQPSSATTSFSAAHILSAYSGKKNGFTNALLSKTNGFIYALSEQNYVLKFNTNSYEYEKICLYIDEDSGCEDVYQHYNDFCEHSDGNLYAVPFNANKILKINLESSEVSSVGEDSETLGHGELYKWSKSIVGNDGCVYGIPLDATHVLRFNPQDESIKTIGPELTEEDKWWSACLAHDGDLYCAPYCTDSVLKICVSKWHRVKYHVQLRLLIDQGRASPIIQSIDDDEGMEKGRDYSTTITKSSTCYQHFIQNFDDYLFRHVLEFL